MRMHESRIPKALFYGELLQGVRTIAPKKRFKDSLKSALEACYIEPGKWEEVALDHPIWHRVCYEGNAYFETARISSLKEKRQPRKVKCSSFAPTFTTTATDGGFHCDRCQRVYGSRIGLSSHLRWHTRQDTNGT